MQLSFGQCRGRCRERSRWAGWLGLLLACYTTLVAVAAPALAAAPAGAPAAAHTLSAFRYVGLCDASAAVALDTDRFVVADDERNTLAIYRTGRNEAIEQIDLSRFLDTKADKESDIEGAARVGQRIFWISSHGRNAKGEAQERRQRFFATDIAGAGQPSLRPVGSAYSKLLNDLIRAPSLSAFDLHRAAKLAPEAPGGLNIEGLAATPNGTLLIGFRSPLHLGRALLVLLLNPADLLRGVPAQFGVPIELDLGGRGIRSIERAGARYVIVAGPTADNGRFALFEWSGRALDPPVVVAGPDFGDAHPEALLAFANTGQMYSLSDDGGRMIGGKRCKDLAVVDQAFRAQRLR